jgi:hypothetical protein
MTAFGAERCRKFEIRHARLLTADNVRLSEVCPAGSPAILARMAARRPQARARRRRTPERGRNAGTNQGTARGIAQ